MKLKRGNANLNKRARRVVATATAFTFLCQNFVWALCADGSTFPAGGFVAGQPPVTIWSPGLGGDGSVFVPDISVFEHNDPGQPRTGGGHNWVFDVNSFCKMIDIGPAGGAPTAWQSTFPPPPVQPPGLQNPLLPQLPTADCFGLTTQGAGPVAGSLATIGQGETITPTCDPTLLSQAGAPNAANTRLNQLGCAISHGVATTPQTATTFLFVAVIPASLQRTLAQSGLFVVQLVNVPTPGAIGGEAGKTVGAFDFYSDIPGGQRLTSAAVSPDGMFATATSNRRLQSVFACLNPLGDPGDPGLPIDPNFSIPPPSQVKCMVVGNNNLAVDQTTAFGPDDQPYFGGSRTVDTFNADPGGSSSTAWPQCIFNGFVFPPPPPTTLMGKLEAVFNAHSANHCGNAVPNPAFAASPVIQPNEIISHGSFMYTGGTAQPVVQFKVTVDPVTGLSHYAARTYFSGGSGSTTGLGVADDLTSLMVFTINSLNNATVIFKLPLCEDM